VPAPEPIDLHHLGRERVIASYLLDTEDGPQGREHCISTIQGPEPDFETVVWCYDLEHTCDFDWWT
jgi:hypothetical protein